MSFTYGAEWSAVGWGAEITNCGPPHCDRLATTLARSVRSANWTFGWALSLCQASFVGINSNWLGLLVGDDADGHPKQLDESPQHREMVSAEQSQFDDELLIASQKAWPNESPAHARQLFGSPEHVAFWYSWTGKIEFRAVTLLRLRRGTGGS